jgi:hypothetical protein
MNAHDFMVIIGSIPGLLAVAYFIVVFIETIDWKKDSIALRVEASLGIIICLTIAMFIVGWINYLLTIG